MRRFLSLTGLMFLIFLSHTYAQEVRNMDIKFEDGSIAVYYDIVDADTDQLYEFYLYGSHDNYQKPLQQVKGDVGQYLKPGNRKKISWDARNEFGNFKGDLNLKIKGGKLIPLIKFHNSPAGKNFKRSNALDITWDSRYPSENLTLQLLNAGTPVTKLISIKNNGEYIFEIPGDLKPGSGYQIKISAPDNPLKHETTGTFTIKRKIPLALKFAPIAVVGGVVYFISSGSNEEENKAIPDPPVAPSHVR